MELEAILNYYPGGLPARAKIAVIARICHVRDRCEEITEKVVMIKDRNELVRYMLHTRNEFAFFPS